MARDVCLDCEEDECVLDRNIKWDTEEEETIAEQVDVQCENCGILETLELIEGKLGPHSRFTETHHLTDGKICGIIRRLG